MDKMFLLFPPDILEGEMLEICCLILMRHHLLFGRYTYCLLSTD